MLALGIYWLAHSYSTVLGRRLSRQEHLTIGCARASAGARLVDRPRGVDPTAYAAHRLGGGRERSHGHQRGGLGRDREPVVFELLAGLRARSTPREFALEGGVGVVMGLAILALKFLAH